MLAGLLLAGATAAPADNWLAGGWMPVSPARRAMTDACRGAQVRTSTANGMSSAIR